MARYRTPPPDASDLSRSQNVLTSRRLVERLLDRSTIQANDLVVEIGAGRGIITEALARRSRRVVAVEIDPRLAAGLRRRFAGRSNVVIREADFLDVSLPRGPYKVFANIPFDRTAAIVTKLTAARCPPDDVYLILQHEAAARFSGEPRESLIAALLKPWFEPTIVHRFRRHDFTPAPGVDVVMLRLHKRGPPLVSADDAQLYRDFVTTGFTAWRRSVADTLGTIVGRRAAAVIAREAGLAPDATPGLVRFEQWLRVFRAWRAGDRAARTFERVAGAERRLRRQQRRLVKVHRTRGAQTRRPPPARRIA